MLLHPDLYSKESELITTSKNLLSDGKYKDPLTRMRLMCLTRGSTGLLQLGRSFRALDNKGKHSISADEFWNAFQNMGLNIPKDDVREMFENFEKNDDGTINLPEFIAKLRPPLNDRRLDIIGQAFRKVDKKELGVITLEDLRKFFNVKDHPKYLNGDKSEEELVSKFMDHFKVIGVHDGVLSREEFINYYAAVSATIDDDTFFDLVLRKAYKI